MYTKIKNLENKVQDICASVCSMAERQDEKFDMVFEKDEMDEY